MNSTSTSKPKPSELLAGEDLARGARLEKLEAALRVVERQSCDHAHDAVENAADDFAEDRLVHADQRTVHRARSDRHLRVFALHGAPEFLHLVDRRRKIGVGEERPFALGFEHSVADGVAFAAIAGILEHARAGGAGHCGGPVAEPSSTTTISANSHWDASEVSLDLVERAR